MFGKLNLLNITFEFGSWINTKLNHILLVYFIFLVLDEPKKRRRQTGKQADGQKQTGRRQEVTR